MKWKNSPQARNSGNISSLHCRIERLETRVRNQRLLFLCGALIFAVLLVGGSGSPLVDEVRVSRLALVDSAGKERGSFEILKGYSVLMLGDASGRACLALSVGKAGGATLNMANPKRPEPTEDEKKKSRLAGFRESVSLGFGFPGRLGFLASAEKGSVEALLERFPPQPRLMIVSGTPRKIVTIPPIEYPNEDTEKKE